MQRKFNTEKAFGVEIELTYPNHIGSRMELAHKLTNLVGADFGYEIKPAGYSAPNAPYFKITTDSTVHAHRSDYIGSTEIVSPPLKGYAGLKTIEKLLEAINSLDCLVNKSCGLHVHHDMRDFRESLENGDTREQTKARKAISNLIRLVSRWEPMIYGLVPKSRRPGKFNGYSSYNVFDEITTGDKYRWAVSISDLKTRENGQRSNISMYDAQYRTDWSTGKMVGEYAKNNKVAVKEMKTKLKGYSGNHGRMDFQKDRYCGLNFRKFWLQGSVEFRYGGATLNFEKMRGWIVYTQAFVNTMRDRATDFNNLTAELDYSNHGKMMSWMKRNLGLMVKENGCEHVNETSVWLNKRWKELPNQNWMKQ